jgi:hypothetical protein
VPGAWRHRNECQPHVDAATDMRAEPWTRQRGVVKFGLDDRARHELHRSVRRRPLGLAAAATTALGRKFASGFSTEPISATYTRFATSNFVASDQRARMLVGAELNDISDPTVVDQARVGGISPRGELPRAAEWARSLQVAPLIFAPLRTYSPPGTSYAGGTSHAAHPGCRPVLVYN